jgi:cell division protein FtsB
MTQEAGGAARPSKMAITRLLAEAETKRRRVVMYSLTGLLLPLVVGGALLAYTAVEVNRKLKEKSDLDEQIKSEKAEVDRLRQEKAELQSDKTALALTVGKIQNDVHDAAQKGVAPQTLERTILGTIAANPTVEQSTPRVFIQLNDEKQTRKAEQVGGALRKLGYLVQPFQTKAGPKDNTEVRYYRPEDLDAANKVAEILSGAKLPNVKVRKLDGAARPGTLEVWFPPAPADSAQTQEDAGECPLENKSTLDARIKQAVAKAKASDASAADKKAAAQAYFERARAYDSDRPYYCKKYALYDYRQVLKYAPDYDEARKSIAIIEDLYRQVGNPVP